MTNKQTTNSDPDYLLEEGIIVNGKWEILNFIAKGGKGEVYLARQLNLNRQVALKIMSREFIKSLEGDEEEINSETQRFHREVQVMARMQHPNILQVYDFDQFQINDMELDYIVMEYVPGPTLREKMPKEGLGYDEDKVKTWIKKYFLPILEGMKVVHDKGVIHRDMKPENVLVDDGPPKIMDFGIAGGHNFKNVTQTHHMVGTITYMPEEQFIDLALTDVRVDVYALGKIIYEVVDGKMKKGRDKPFNSVALNNPSGKFFKTLDRIIQQATVKNRNQRTPSVNSLYDSLEELVFDADKIQGAAGKKRYRYWKFLFSASIILIFIIVGALLIHHYFGSPTANPNVTTGNNQINGIELESVYSAGSKFKFKNSQPTPSPIIDKSLNLPGSLLASDNMTMILLKGAEVFMPLDDPVAEGEHAKKTLHVKRFYMDKTKITNHLYAQFLNEVEGIEVKNKSVTLNGKLLLLLGEVQEGYNPITFENKKFRVKPESVSKPVVRVTPLGAVAYAQFYGKSLPRMEQWWLAVQAGHNQTAVGMPSPVSRPQMWGWNENGMMHGQESRPEPLTKNKKSSIEPVTRTTANTAGIHGLGQNVNEWTTSISTEGTPKFHIHGGIGELNQKESYLERQPWEAFASVGFRTILELKEQNDSK
ncbi:MAG: bifunctional serine/threonine-protein kinase/formylglycine-generating enzyme family protein [Desulfobacula sp.]|nr:bifunctional serine/threonine-protein kinase/formylglycine-generating enzyme family protein [Desulfobacula sp.]